MQPYASQLHNCTENLLIEVIAISNKITVDNGKAPLEIRLVGNSILRGRIEILYYGTWGTICDSYFDLDSANVACRRLGFPGAAQVIRSVAPGSGRIWLNNVQCVGNETGLEQCSHDGFGNIAWYCNHYDDVGVECLRKFLKFLIKLCYMHVFVYIYVANILGNANFSKYF